MRFRRNTIDYQITMDNLRWIEEVIPMTQERRERRSERVIGMTSSIHRRLSIVI